MAVNISIKTLGSPELDNDRFNIDIIAIPELFKSRGLDYVVSVGDNKPLLYTYSHRHRFALSLFGKLLARLPLALVKVAILNPLRFCRTILVRS